MQALRSRPGIRRGGIIYLRTDELTPNPVQPRKRFDDDTIAALEKLRWWDWDEERIRENLSAIQNGDINALK